MKKKCKGSITVFLSLMLVVMITVTSVCLESAHQEAVEAELAMKSEEAGMNLFSHFEQKLYEDYEVLALNDRLDIAGIAKASLAEQSTGAHINYKLEQVTLGDTSYLADQNGKGFQEEVNEIMTEQAVKKIMKELEAYLKKGKESEELTEQLDLISKDQGKLTDLVEQFTSIGQNCNSINRIADVMYEAMEGYYEAGKNYQVGDMTFEYSTFEYRRKLQLNQSRLLTQTEDLLKQILSYKQLALELSCNLKSSEDALADSSLSKESKDLIFEQVQSIKDLTQEDGKSYQAIVQLEKSLEIYKASLQAAMYPELETLMEAIRQELDVYSLFRKGFQVLEEMKKLQLAEEKKDTSSVDAAAVKKLLNTVKEIIKKGPYGYIIGGKTELSEREIDRKEMPSITYKKNSSEDTEHILKRVVVETADACVMNCYLYQFMGCLTDSKTYDLEYILGGKNTDQQNLKVVINQLVGLRSTMNLAYLMTDKSKREQAEMAALAITTGFGLPALEKVASLVILSAWAYAEAVLDVKSLVEGGRVPFVKSKDNWRLSLTSASNVETELEKSKTQKKGLTYKEYLRIMLFFHSRTRNLYRGLDMMQWHICEKDSGFRISQCIYETSIQVQAKAPFLFISESLAGKYSGKVSQLSIVRKVGYRSIEGAHA